MRPYASPLLFALFAFLSACTNGGDAGKSPAGKPPAAVEVSAATPQRLVDGIEVTGNLEPKFYADVKTQIPGLVKQVYVTEWVRVSKGQLLAKIDLAETEAMVKRSEASVESARASLVQAQVTLNRAERELERLRKLKEAGLATQQAVDDAGTEADSAKARIEAARAQIRAAEEDVRQLRARQAKGDVVSPIDGIVAMRGVNIGDLASDAAAGKPIFRIVDNRILNLTVTLPSAESARVKVGQQLEFTVDSLPGRIFSGRVMYINPEYDQADRSLKVIAEVANRDDTLKGGLFAKGRIIAGTRDNVIQLPRQSLTGWDATTGRANLFVIENGAAKSRQVSTGVVSGDLVEISSGLKAGEKYVTRGGFNLKDGDRVALSGTAAQK